MSGGYYDYSFTRVEDFAHDIKNTKEDPRRASFSALLKLVATAMREVEWVDSGDNSPGDEHNSIDRVFSFLEKDSNTIIKAAAFDELKGNLRGFLGI